MERLKRVVVWVCVIISVILVEYVNALSPKPTQPVLVAQVHGQNYGWANKDRGGTVTVGTTGKSLRLEAIRVWVEGRGIGVVYQTHLAGIGWVTATGDGKMSGTTGQGRRLEAIAFNFTGSHAGSAYDIQYRAHVAGIGWQGWRSGGEVAGTTGKSRAIEALQIRVIERKTPDLGSKLADGIRRVDYYIDSSATQFVNRINGAVHNWMYTGWDNPLYMERLYHNQGSDIDIYSVPYVFPNRPNVVGVTGFYDNQNRQIINYRNPNSRHDYSIIWMSSAHQNMEYFDAAIKHELGHAFGMDHSKNLWSIMYENQSMQVRSVQKVDSDKLIDLYGWDW
ncbi:Matrixin [Pilibacter termitis]|uniref:Matrixin n=1 Tax=Pilibacter termitis TaxID=263852 RepID=A0A1T4LNE7_9ENTE|nr:matrixin family metalloprotease [Pilibacter termitis]SJZ56181.1 Matrixin [Pilibacter termitis]